MKKEVLRALETNEIIWLHDKNDEFIELITLEDIKEKNPMRFIEKLNEVVRFRKIDKNHIYCKCENL